jgi:hypothetical protein
MSAPEREGADGRWFPPPSTFTLGWRIPAAILEPLLRRPTRRGAPAGAGADGVRSADGSDAKLSPG